MMTDNEKLINLLRGLMQMQTEQTHAYHRLLDNIKNSRQDASELINSATDEHHIFRLQGKVKCLDDILEFLEKPNELLLKIENLNG